MPELKQILTYSFLDVIGSTFSLKTLYQEGVLPYTLFALIAANAGSQEGISYVQGELLMSMVNYPFLIDYNLDSSGNLIVVADDATSYSINSDGDLIYTY